MTTFKHTQTMNSEKSVPDSLTDLSWSEQLTLWSMRYWSDGFRQNYSPYETLREAYSRTRCPGALMALDNFLSLVVAGHSRLVDIRCLCCEGISDDEWCLLQSLALAQSDCGGQIKEMLSGFLEPATARVAQSVIIGWAKELREGGLILPLRSRVLETIPLTHVVEGRGITLRVYTNPQTATLH
jgi:hypothetical protein